MTFTAMVGGSDGGAPTGTVQFTDGSTVLATVALTPGGMGAQATFTTSALSPGDHPITAVYSGDVAYAGSTSSVLTQTVQQATTYTSVTSYLNPSAPGQAVTFTAMVGGSPGSPPTGQVMFMDGTTVLGTATLTPGGMGAQAAFTTSSLAPGAHSITAVYGGDPTYAGSTSSVLTQNVQLASTFTSLYSSANPSPFGQPVTFTANVQSQSGAPTGTVSFYDGTTLLATVALNNRMAAFTTAALARGSHSITAVHSGDAADAGSSSQPFTETIQ